ARITLGGHRRVVGPGSFRHRIHVCPAACLRRRHDGSGDDTTIPAPCGRIHPPHPAGVRTPTAPGPERPVRCSSPRLAGTSSTPGRPPAGSSLAIRVRAPLSEVADLPLVQQRQRRSNTEAMTAPATCPRVGPPSPDASRDLPYR